MDFERRIQEASQYVDQTKASYDAAKKQTGIAQSDYDTSFTTAPTYQTIYEQYKQQYTDTQELSDMKNSWELTKSNVDSVKSMIDNLPDSINRQFGGSALTQAQRDMAKNKQLQNLNKQFTQYNADYQVQFANYNDAVDKAFSEALDVSNKNYDSYWDGVRAKFDAWQSQMESEKNWEKMYGVSRDQLNAVYSEYQDWQNQQEIIKMKREFEQWQNEFAATSRQMAYNSAQYMSGYDSKVAAKEKYRSDSVKLYKSGQISWSELQRRVQS